MVLTVDFLVVLGEVVMPIVIVAGLLEVLGRRDKVILVVMLLEAARIQN